MKLFKLSAKAFFMANDIDEAFLKLSEYFKTLTVDIEGEKANIMEPGSKISIKPVEKRGEE